MLFSAMVFPRSNAGASEHSKTKLRVFDFTALYQDEGIFGLILGWCARFMAGLRFGVFRAKVKFRRVFPRISGWPESNHAIRGIQG